MCHIELFASMAHITAQCHSVLKRIITLGQIKYRILFVRSKLNKSNICFNTAVQCTGVNEVEINDSR